MKTKDPIEQLRRMFDEKTLNYQECRWLLEEIEAAYMKLPVNADGVPIRPGQTLYENNREIPTEHVYAVSEKYVYTWHLLPCPFCGSKAEIKSGAPYFRYVHIACTNENCLASQIFDFAFNTEEEAVEAWNTRANRLETTKLGSGTCLMTKLERFDGDEPAYQCSECGHKNYEPELPAFCPNCGAMVTETHD